MSQHLAFLEGLPSGPADRFYFVVPSRSHEGAVAVMKEDEFLTGSYDLKWAVRYAEGLAIFDRLQGIDADVWVALEATGEGA